MKIDKLEYYSSSNNGYVWERHPNKDDIVKKINEIIDTLNKTDEVEKDDEMNDETILEHFAKVLPYAELNLATFCPQDLDSRLQGLCKPNYCDCYKCWTRKYKDSFKVKEDEN